MASVGLDELFRECEQLEAQMANQFPEFFKPVAKQNTFSQPALTPPVSTDKTETITQNAGKESKPVAANITTQQDWQVSAIRAKFFKRSSGGTQRTEQGKVPLSSFDDQKQLIEMGSEERFIALLSKLAKGSLDSELLQGMLIQKQDRTEANLSLRFLLSALAAGQQPISRKKLQDSIRELTYDKNSIALYASGQALQYILDTAETIERLQDEGFRNRQELLDKAEREAEQKFNDADRKMRNWQG